MANYIEQILKEKNFINGIYVPWFDKEWFGFDIGKSVYDNYEKCFFNEPYIKSVFTNCKVIGFDMAKIWLNESFEGMLFDEQGSVMGVEPAFLKNLEKIFQIIKELNFKLSICVNAHQEMYFPNDKSLYDKYMRFVYVPEETEKYITNWLNPILELAQKYDCVPLIDLYAEPEADGGGWKVSRGFSWKSMVRFINRLHVAVKEINPLFATTVSSGSGCYTLSQGMYNQINVDYLGADLYTDNGKFDTPKSMLLSRPFMLGEYGLSNYETATDEEQINIVDTYLKNANKNQVAAAFYWCYGWKCDKADEMHLLDSQGEFRPVVSYYHFSQIDRNNKLRGLMSDEKPELLAIVSPQKIRWFGTRGAKCYKVLRIDRDSTVEIAVLKDDDMDLPLIFRYSDENGNDDCKYQIISVMPDGREIFSDTADVIKGAIYK